jgi:predicted  nucleic acid-binding Zn-ribbon protein
LEEELTRNSRYISENVDLHIFKTQLENSYRELKEENESCEREKFELQEQMIDMETQLQVIRQERDQYLTNLINTEHDLKTEAV